MGDIRDREAWLANQALEILFGKLKMRDRESCFYRSFLSHNPLKKSDIIGAST